MNTSALADCYQLFTQHPIHSLNECNRNTSCIKQYAEDPIDITKGCGGMNEIPLPLTGGLKFEPLE